MSTEILIDEQFLSQFQNESNNLENVKKITIYLNDLYLDKLAKFIDIQKNLKNNIVEIEIHSKGYCDQSMRRWF